MLKMRLLLPVCYPLTSNPSFIILQISNLIKTIHVIMALQVGDKAPEILGLDQAGKEIRLSDFAGKKLALYFYPKDNTSGCTAEACSFRDNYDALREAGYEVVGVSKDSAKSHQGFIAKQNLPFTLIADTETALQQTFGVWVEKKMYGRAYMGTARTTFIIDETGTITHVFGPKEIKTKEHANQILNLK